MRTSRLVAAVTVATSLTAGLVACGSSDAKGSGSQALTKVSVSYASAVGNEIPTWIAKDEGFFKKNGLDVSFQVLPATNAVAGVLSDSVNIADVGGSETLSAAAEGGNMKVVATLMPVFNWKFYAKPAITQMSQLKGKKIGITKPGAGFDLGLRLALPKEGITPDKDVTFIPTGSIENVTAALIGGSIDGAAVVVGPDSEKLEDSGFKALFDFGQIGLPTVNSCIVVNGSFAKSHKDAVQHYVDAIVEAINFEKTNPEETKKVIGKYFNTTDQKLIDYTYDYYSKTVPDVPNVAAAQFADTQRLLGASSAKVKDYDINDLIDNSFVEQASASASSAPSS